MREEARFVGINHVALEVGDVDKALEFYGRLFAFELRGQVGPKMAFIDAGDQFIAIAAGRSQAGDDAALRARRRRCRCRPRRTPTRGSTDPAWPRGLDFLDPRGNRVQVVQYDEIQFTKSEAALRKLGAQALGKTAKAEAEMREKELL